MDENSFERQTASILDKTDWRKSIQRYVDQCIQTIGTIHFPNAVEKLVASIYADFPNWDARIFLNQEINKINLEYDIAIKKHMEKYIDYWVHPGKRLTFVPDIIASYYTDIFRVVFNMLAKRRMLLWGAVESQAVSYDELQKLIQTA